MLGDTVNIGNRNNTNIKELGDKYVAERGSEHYMYQLSENLDYEIGQKGKLGDMARENEFRDIRDFFGIEHSYNHLISIPHPYLFDFDLDFFTMSCEDGSLYGWTEKIFRKHFVEDRNVYSSVSQLISNSKIITICREPDFCGSLGDSNQILYCLDKYFFNGRIGTATNL